LATSALGHIVVSVLVKALVGDDDALRVRQVYIINTFIPHGAILTVMLIHALLAAIEEGH
jgi:hypothetical protein